MAAASTMSRFRMLYGARPWHLLLLLASLALAGYTIATLGLSNLWDSKVWWQSILVWFAGAIIAHDLILFPLYAAADRLLSTGRNKTGKRRTPTPMVSALNHIRIPLLAVGLLFLVYFPGIIGQGAASYQRATGQNQDPFLLRWLVISAVILALSAIIYGVRLGLAKRRQPGAGQPDQKLSA